MRLTFHWTEVLVIGAVMGMNYVGPAAGHCLLHTLAPAPQQHQQQQQQEYQSQLLRYCN